MLIMKPTTAAVFELCEFSSRGGGALCFGTRTVIEAFQALCAFTWSRKLKNTSHKWLAIETTSHRWKTHSLNDFDKKNFHVQQITVKSQGSQLPQRAGLIRSKANQQLARTLKCYKNKLEEAKNPQTHTNLEATLDFEPPVTSEHPETEWEIKLFLLKRNVVGQTRRNPRCQGSSLINYTFKKTFLLLSLLLKEDLRVVQKSGLK